MVGVRIGLLLEVVVEGWILLCELRIVEGRARRAAGERERRSWCWKEGKRRRELVPALGGGGWFVVGVVLGPGLKEEVEISTGFSGSYALPLGLNACLR
jgi:hypothetical protein